MSLSIGQRVTYANGLYVVAVINADLLTLDGIADARRNCRERVTVLAGDVTVCAAQATTAGQCGPIASEVATDSQQSETGGCL